MRSKQNLTKPLAVSSRLVFLGVCLTLLAVPRPASADTLINFDDVPGGTVVNTHYSGVTITCTAFSCDLDNSVYAVTTPNAFSGPNALISTGEGLDMPGILFVFDVPQAVVTIEGSTNPDFTLGGAVYTNIDDVSGQITPSSGSYSLFSVSSPSGSITAIAVNANGPNLEAIGTTYLDNLCFSTSITGCGNQGSSTAPEPGTLELLLAGALVIGSAFLARCRNRSSLMRPNLALQRRSATQAAV
ncbi:MAG TPA: PEP-CTERM sorting domain-containing protein [Candidatus Acidoferrum sp.]|nr:PEP-CTERM sorting domain-containing protein [Candidatus Acidoferrum sp.]